MPTHRSKERQRLHQAFRIEQRDECPELQYPTGVRLFKRQHICKGQHYLFAYLHGNVLERISTRTTADTQIGLV